MRKPVVENMMKALYFQFTAGVLPLYAVCFVGYWAYGNKTSSYLLNNVSGPIWVKAMANIAAFLQTVIALHVCLFFFFGFFQPPTFYFLKISYQVLIAACRYLQVQCMSIWTLSLVLKEVH